MRGATKKSEGFRRIEQISIHAPRAGSDRAERNAVDALSNFNPRSPCGERQGCVRIRIWSQRFQSTLPVRGATLSGMARTVPARISIHAPRAGSDCNVHDKSICILISIHAPRAGSDPIRHGAYCSSPHFNPRSPCGERQQYIVLLQAQSAIYTQSAILSIVNAIKGRRLLIEFGAKACGISCVLQIRTHKTSGSSTGIVSFEP